MLVGGEAGEQVVHRANGGEVVRFLDVDEPVDEQLFVGSGGNGQRAGALDGFGSRLTAIGGVTPDGVGQSEMRIADGGLAGVDDGIVEQHVFVLVD
jgi:hypothetical protein